MARFYLNVVTRDWTFDDPEGIDLPDAVAARGMAVLGLRDILAQEVMAGTLDLGTTIVIEDESGRSLESVASSDVLEIKLAHQSHRETGSWH